MRILMGYKERIFLGNNIAFILNVSRPDFVESKIVRYAEENELTAVKPLFRGPLMRDHLSLRTTIY